MVVVHVEKGWRLARKNVVSAKLFVTVGISTPTDIAILAIIIIIIGEIYHVGVIWIWDDTIGIIALLFKLCKPALSISYEL